MKLSVKIVLCVLLALFAAASILTVMADLGLLPERTAAVSAESGYMLRAWEGRVAVFCPPDAETPLTVTDIRLRELPFHDRLSLQAGLPAADHQAVTRLLEDLGA